MGKSLQPKIAEFQVLFSPLTWPANMEVSLREWHNKKPVDIQLVIILLMCFHDTDKKAMPASVSTMMMMMLLLLQKMKN